MSRKTFARISSSILFLLGIATSSACAVTRGTTVIPANTAVGLPTQTPADTPSPELVSPQLVACSPYQCAMPEFWQLGPDGPEALSLPIAPGSSYDATSATGRLLYSTRYPDHGAGPGDVSVGDLWWLDVRSGQTRPIIPDEVVVEAAWAPNGQDFAYVRATSATYELHWYTPSGEDKQLAKDVAFTFSVSPAGDPVTFTRESNYKVAGIPGLYVVDIAAGQELRISGVDRAGPGSTVDLPVWSPDGEHVLLPASGTEFNAWLIAAADGSGSAQLNISPEVSAAFPNENLSFTLWHPDGLHLVGSTFSGMGGGPSKVVLFGLNPALDTVISATVLKDDDSIVVSWDKPGVSLWVRSVDGVLENVPLE
jgi:hypothetical protein